METKEIIILAAALGIAGINLYRKYIAKKDGKTGSTKTNDLLSSHKNDDYEPYSGK